MASALAGVAVATGIVAFSLRAPAPLRAAPAAAGPAQLLAWNNLGMHCIDPDFSVFSILPPFNTVDAQLVVDNRLQTTGNGVSVTYRGFADPTGSVNTSSIGKTNFWEHVQELFGVSLPLDVGLTGNAMPGVLNLPQPMAFDGTWNWFEGEGIPITPFDDALVHNPYPLMRFAATYGVGSMATTVATVPNSDELQCTQCHASAGNPAAMPAAGWLFDPDPVRDNRLNILRLHDERQLGDPEFAAALATAGYDPTGLYATVTQRGTAILCDRCHGSNALPGTGLPGIEPLTQAMHGLHANVMNPDGDVLDRIPTRVACYSCHPGFVTQCARGAMEKAIGPNGSFLMHCQSCHGNLSAVASPSRNAWLEEPDCQSCHTGSATVNSGQIRFTTVFDATGQTRTPASTLFATQPNVPAPGYSLYRFSADHGGMRCAACHGSPHAVYPTSVANDNIQSQLVQGHEGTISECSACHDDRGSGETNGPHGMHPVSLSWVKDLHPDIVESSGVAQCRACHGNDLRGTVLSYAQGNRAFTIGSGFGTKTLFRGAQVSCYHCHNGPNSGDPTSNRRPSVPSPAVATPNDVPLQATLTGTDPDGDPLTFRIVAQPKQGTVGWSGATVTYFPKAGYLGTDSFTYAAWDGKSDSNLGTVTVLVGPASCAGTIERYGFGCGGAGGFLPRLDVSGCPSSAGGTIEFSLDRGPGGGVAVLCLGVTRGTAMLRGGCALRIGPVLAVSPPLVLAGSGAGNGTVSLPVSIAPGTLGTVTLQALVVDPGSPRGWSASNAVEVTVR